MRRIGLQKRLPTTALRARLRTNAAKLVAEFVVLLFVTIVAIQDEVLVFVAVLWQFTVRMQIDRVVRTVRLVAIVWLAVFAIELGAILVVEGQAVMTIVTIQFVSA